MTSAPGFKPEPKESPMQSIKVSRYPNPKGIGWAGYIEPEDKSWIAFIGLDGKPVFFLHRDPGTGAILPDDPEERASFLQEERTGFRTGMVCTGEGHVVQPLGIGPVDGSIPDKP